MNKIRIGAGIGAVVIGALLAACGPTGHIKNVGPGTSPAPIVSAGQGVGKAIHSATPTTKAPYGVKKAGL